MQQKITTLIVLGLALVLGSAAAAAGNNAADSTKAPVKTAVLKTGNTTQGTFAYRFDTYSNYIVQSGCNATFNPGCAASLNDELRDGSTPNFPKVNTPVGTKPSNTTSVVETEKAK